MLHAPRQTSDYSSLKVPAPIKGLVQSVEDQGGYDKVVFSTENETRYIIYVPHYDERMKSNIRKGHGLILRHAQNGDKFGVASVRAFLETGVEKNKPLSQWQTVRTGLAPFFHDAADVHTKVISGKVDEKAVWEKGWDSLVVEANLLSHIAVPQVPLTREAQSRSEDDELSREVKIRDRVVAFPTQNVAFFYPRNGGFRGISAVKPSIYPSPL